MHTRYQEAVAQQISNGFAQVGVVNPTIARKWVQGWPGAGGDAAGRELVGAGGA